MAAKNAGEWIKENNILCYEPYFEKCWNAAIKSVEENGNNIQQLKAEIAALRLRMLNSPTGKDCYIQEYAEVLQQLSAV